MLMSGRIAKSVINAKEIQKRQREEEAPKTGRSAKEGRKCKGVEEASQSGKSAKERQKLYPERQKYHKVLEA